MCHRLLKHRRISRHPTNPCCEPGHRLWSRRKRSLLTTHIRSPVPTGTSRSNEPERPPVRCRKLVHTGNMDIAKLQAAPGSKFKIGKWKADDTHGISKGHADKASSIHVEK